MPNDAEHSQFLSMTSVNAENNHKSDKHRFSSVTTVSFPDHPGAYLAVMDRKRSLMDTSDVRGVTRPDNVKAFWLSEEVCSGCCLEGGDSESIDVCREIRECQMEIIMETCKDHIRLSVC
jgi:hypothetical protein